MAEIIIRKAKGEDYETIGKLIQELADFEKMSDQPIIDYKILERDGCNGQPLFLCYVAVFNEEIIGYVFVSYYYSTWYGKILYLDDLYVKSEFRRKEIGEKLLKTVAKEAVMNNCNRLDFNVLKWNSARKFYKKHGSIDLTVKEQWHYYCISGENLKKLASDTNITFFKTKL